mgnify:CR=1 FL=1
MTEYQKPINKFIPHYLIRPIKDSDKVTLRVINPNDLDDTVSLLVDGVEEACLRIMSVYNAEIGDEVFFYSWDDALNHYEGALQDSEDDWGDDDDPYWDSWEDDESTDNWI